MKKLFFLPVFILICLVSFSQVDSTAQYIKSPELPSFSIYKAPDSTAFSKGDLKKKEETVIIIFSPDCEHCQHETEALIKGIDKFKNTQILMITYLPYNEMMAFYKTYKIADYPQITMARDTKFFFPVFFKIKNLPSIFVYDKNGNFKKSFEGSVKIDSIAAAL